MMARRGDWPVVAGGRGNRSMQGRMNSGLARRVEREWSFQIDPL
jgi:hypothetical protein